MSCHFHSCCAQQKRLARNCGVERRFDRADSRGLPPHISSFLRSSRRDHYHNHRRRLIFSSPSKQHLSAPPPILSVRYLQRPPGAAPSSTRSRPIAAHSPTLCTRIAHRATPRHISTRLLRDACEHPPHFALVCGLIASRFRRTAGPRAPQLTTPIVRC